jgi:predicted chitinase
MYQYIVYLFPIVFYMAFGDVIIRIGVHGLGLKKHHRHHQCNAEDTTTYMTSSQTAAVSQTAAAQASSAATGTQASQTAGASQTSSAATSSSSSSSSSGGAISDSDFKNAVTALGKADAASKSSYFISSLKDAGITTKREAAMFLAQVWHESGALQYKEEIACSGSEAKAAACDANYPIKGNGVKGKHYYGRGYIQLTWDTNYEAASKDLLGDGKQLLNAPEKVASDESLAWRSAAWYWKSHVHTAAGVSQGKFGASTKAINGALECSGGDTTKPKKRFEFYKTILKAFGDSSTPDESGCYS